MNARCLLKQGWQDNGHLILNIHLKHIIMARLKNGILGGIHGAMGNIEGYLLKGEYIVRSRRKKSTKPPTEKQLACRQKMLIVNNFLGAFIQFIQIGFTFTATNKTYTAYNAAIAYQLKYAVTGQYPNYTIDYKKAQLTEGPMTTDGINAGVTLQDNNLIFTWTADLSYKHSNDHVMLLAYAPALNEATYNLCGAKRSVGNDVLILPDDTWKGKVIETYLSFINESRTQCTNSLYMGQVKAPTVW
jgi:hypothetical protein